MFGVKLAMRRPVLPAVVHSCIKLLSIVLFDGERRAGLGVCSVDIQPHSSEPPFERVLAGDEPHIEAIL